MKGVILSGGLSSRFGYDKSSVIFPCVGKDVLQLELEVLNGLDLSAIAVSCSPMQAAQFESRVGSGVDILSDDEIHIDRHPIFGLTACLRRFGEPLLVMPCDIPLMRADVLRRLLDSRRDILEDGQHEHALLRTLFRHSNGRAEPLIAVYECESLPFLLKAIRSGRMGLFNALPLDKQLFVPCPDEESFLNMNTQEDFAYAEKRLETLRAKGLI